MKGMQIFQLHPHSRTAEKLKGEDREQKTTEISSGFSMHLPSKFYLQTAPTDAAENCLIKEIN